MPKGVYPRRKVGRPAKAANPAAPAKPVVPADMTRWEYIDADTEIIRLNGERKDLYTKRNDLKSEVSKALRKLQTYENAINVLADKVSHFQCSDESEDNAVHNITGHYAECWASGFGDVMDELRTLSLKCSKDAWTKSEEAQELDRKADANWEETKTLRTKRGEEWDKAKAEQLKEVDG